MSRLRTYVRKDLTFEASHDLRGFVSDDHKCARPHGHTYRVSVEMSVETHDGWVVDFSEISGIVRGTFDHRHIPGVLRELGFADSLPSTAEVLCDVIWRLLEEQLVMKANARALGADDVIRIEKVSVQEGEGGVAWIARGE